MPSKARMLCANDSLSEDKVDDVNDWNAGVQKDVASQCQLGVRGMDCPCQAERESYEPNGAETCRLLL